MMDDFSTGQVVMRDKLGCVNYIIDGHNLIAHIRGLALGMADDEERLIALLNRYGQHQRGKIEVYFDGAPAGQAGTRSYGHVEAHFVPVSASADAAIRQRLKALGKSVRNWLVVSSDRSIRAAAREVHAGVMKSEEFADTLATVRHAGDVDLGDAADKPLDSAEIDEWLTIFKSHKKRR